MDERVKSGVPGLDELLGGGFPAGGTYVILGNSGTGKSILSTQFLYNGIVKFNEPGVYIMLEEDKERMISNMRRFGWELDKLEQEGKLRIVPYIKSIVGDIDATFDKGIVPGEHERVDMLRQYLTVDSLYREVKQSCETIGAKRVAIDPMTSLTLLSKSEVDVRTQLIWLMEKIRKLKVTTLATVEEGIGYWRDTLFLCDGVVYMILKEKEGIFERGIVIEKMRGTSHDTSVRPLKISNEGIRVYTSEILIRR